MLFYFSATQPPFSLACKKVVIHINKDPPTISCLTLYGYDKHDNFVEYDYTDSSIDVRVDVTVGPRCSIMKALKWDSQDWTFDCAPEYRALQQWIHDGIHSMDVVRRYKSY